MLAEKNELDNKVYAVYISPLKALGNDIHKNLVEPLAEIYELAESRNIKLQKINIALRGEAQFFEWKLAQFNNNYFDTFAGWVASVFLRYKSRQKWENV